jgi:photosystem II stability/assembly factor-like uncharacterized protein
MSELLSFAVAFLLYLRDELDDRQERTRHGRSDAKNTGMNVRLFGAMLLVAALLRAPASPALSQERAQTASFSSALHWRMIGPFRGGRDVAVAGVPSEPSTFYFGAVGGGVWRTIDAGVTWTPIMDSQPVASIGAIAVAPSDPKTIYVGSGEADMRSDIVHGNGMYRSTDAGTTWTRIGLEDTRQIGRILVDPNDAKTLLVAALGHAYGPNDERGVYRSTDGGETWTKTLFKNANTGAIDLAADPTGKTVYASLWQTRRPPWSVYPPSNGHGSGLYVSHDAGITWKALDTNGLPTEGLGKIGIAVAPSDPMRVYAIVDAKAGGLYRSDDAGAHFKLVDDDTRIWQRGWYFCHVAVDPKDENSVYVSDTSFYHSSDGGATFTAMKGSPDGDDFHMLWIDPNEPKRMVLGSDQGTSVTLNGGTTWSSWFNQPTGQFYHVAVDHAFPYHLYGAQQDSGAAMILSRSSHRGIEERDWRAIGAGGEGGYISPDPDDPDAAYGSEGDGDGVVREDFVTNQSRLLTQTLGKPGPWRSEWTQPLAFGPDGALYASHQNVFRSTDGGKHWDIVSGDLARTPLGVVYSLAPSPKNAKLVWAGTDDGLVYLTRNGTKTWVRVTPPGVGPWAHVDCIDASPFDAASAYVAIERHRLDDDSPSIYITHDYGKTWRESHAGIAPASFVNVVRADPERPGLLYAGTETEVYVSFDDGTTWQSLRANMPVVSVRDIAIAPGGDLAIATHGRAFWVLDDVEPLRELVAHRMQNAPYLFTPRDTPRTRDGNDEAEATPPEIVLGENPPNGVFIDYALPASVSAPVALEIRDAARRVLRRIASTDTPHVDAPSDVDYPAYWIVQPKVPEATPGMHRFVWDFRIARADGPLAAPGTYEVALVANGKTLTRPLRITRDPRVKASDADLVAQMKLATAIDGALVRATKTQKSLRFQLYELEAAVESADARPTRDQYARWASLRSSV